MKKLMVFFILLLLPLASAINLESKSQFNQGETFLLQFSGNFQETISKSNIAFYREHVKIPMEFNLMRVDNDYYVYALLKNKEAGNYSVVLENAKYYKQGQIVEEDVQKNFTIKEQFADFSITPGFVSTTEDFEIELQNLQDTEIIIDIDKEYTPQNNSEEKSFLDKLTGNVIFNLGESNSITLSPNEIKKITFKLSDIPEPIVDIINFKTSNTEYSLPVYIPTPINLEEYSVSLDFNPEELKIILEPNSVKEESVILKNVGEEVLENVTFKLSNNLLDYVNVSKDYVTGIAVNASVEILLRFDSTNLDEIVQGELVASIPNETEDLVIILEPFNEEQEEKEVISSTSKNCADIDGTIFEEPKECDGEVRFTADGNCCLGEVQEPKESHVGLIIGWLIILAIIIALAWFFRFKYKPGQGEIDLFKIAKGKS